MRSWHANFVLVPLLLRVGDSNPLRTFNGALWDSTSWHIIISPVRLLAAHAIGDWHGDMGMGQAGEEGFLGS